MAGIEPLWLSDGDWYALFRNESFEIGDCLRAWSEYPSDIEIMKLCGWDRKFSKTERPNMIGERHWIRTQWRVHQFNRTAKAKDAYERWANLENNENVEWLHSPDYYHDFLADLRASTGENEPLEIIPLDALTE